MKHLFCLIFILSALQGFATEEDLFGDEDSIATGTTVEKMKLIFSGTVDARLVHTGTHPNWEDGGRGLTAEGSGADNTPATKFILPRVAVTTDLIIDEKSSAFVQLNVDDHPNLETANYTMGLFEAFYKYKISQNFSTRAGLMVPEISMEHPGTAWSTLFTVTPSALNTWVGEELKVLGAELHYDTAWGKHNAHALRATGSAFSGNDPSGAILAWRGWALHDYQLKAGDRVRYQEVDTQFAPTGWSLPTKEVDGNLASYFKLAYRFKDQFTAEVFQYLNLSSGKANDGVDYTWRNNFTTLSFRWNPSKAWTFINQTMVGRTRMGQFSNPIDVRFYTSYLLASYLTGKHRVSGRAELFQIQDLDQANDDNNQDGWALTASYAYALSSSLTLTAEYVHPVSERKGRENFSTNDPYDDLFMLNSRLQF